MGLDMYLIGKRELIVEELRVIADRMIPEAEAYSTPEVSFTYEVGYWRKAKVINKWFVDNVEQGEDKPHLEHEVPLWQLKDLLKLVKQVLRSPRKAVDLMPWTEGLEYESYRMDLLHTKQILEKIIDDERFEKWTFYYKTSC